MATMEATATTADGVRNAMVTRVIVVDDHAIVRQGVQALVNIEPDMQVVGTAANGRDAVHLVSKLRPHVVIMDITMPELNGIDATEQIRVRFPLTRVVILSMHSDHLHVFRALRAGASGYVTKESGESELIAAVRTVHRGGKHISRAIAETLIDDYIMKNSFLQTGDPLARLSTREREILMLLVDGKTVREIGDILGLSIKTAHTYRYRIMEKLSISDTPGLVRFSIQNNLIPSAGHGKAAPGAGTFPPQT